VFALPDGTAPPNIGRIGYAAKASRRLPPERPRRERRSPVPWSSRRAGRAFVSAPTARRAYREGERRHRRLTAVDEGQQTPLTNTLRRPGPRGRVAGVTPPDPMKGRLSVAVRKGRPAPRA
jgi:hypothetical protein